MADFQSNDGKKGVPEQGDREQFDHFDRLGEVDKKDLSATKLKANDKERSVEDLLATKDNLRGATVDYEGVSVKRPDDTLELNFSKRSPIDIAHIEEIGKKVDEATKSQEELANEDKELIGLKIQLPDAGIIPIKINQAEAQIGVKISPENNNIPNPKK